MAFDLKTWREQVKARMRNWKSRMQEAGVNSVYYSISAGALWPLVDAYQRGDLTTLLTLGSQLAGGVASNLWADQILKWKSEADGARQLAEVTGDLKFHAELDAILKSLNAIKMAREALQGRDRAWFKKALQDERKRFGNKARLKGSGAIAQGRGAKAAGQRGVVGEKIINSNIWTGDLVIERGDQRKELEESRRRYLSRLRRFCETLPLDPLGGEGGVDQEITLDQVYIDLDTTTQVPLTGKEKKQLEKESLRFGRDAESRSLTALEVAAQFPRLVVLGEPGGGKSTFVKQLLAWQAAANLGEKNPPPGFRRDLVPVMIRAGDLAPRLAAFPLENLSGEQALEKLGAAIHEQALADLSRLDSTDFGEGLQESLNSGHCLLVLDGLDEVPYGIRERVHRAVSALVALYQIQRVIVTCRVRSYVGSAVLPGFSAYTLASFDEDKVRRFADAWYNALKKLGRVDAEQARDKANDLAQAALSKDLRELSMNPMMLTTMALIHQREIGLPKERVRLFFQGVDVLLRRWQKQKTGEASMAPASELNAFLKDDIKIRGAAERLAYEAHRLGLKGKDPVDLSRGDLLTLLEGREYLGNAALAAEFLDYVDQRAGLLLGQGGELAHPSTYRFPHRTFQEYLAGCYMIGQRNLTREYFARASEGDYWELAAQLGAEELLFNRRSDHALLDLAYSLCEAKPSSTQARRAVHWSGKLAALLGREKIEGDSESPGGGRVYIEERLTPNLVALLESDLSAHERVDAGRVIAQLGDPRFDPDAWYLPKDGLLGFVEIPEGSFLMGSDPVHDKEAFKDEQPQHPVTVPRYYIARYPVTVAQFSEFVKKKKYKPQYEDCLRGQPNHPVVNVTWHDARAYCDWLTDELKESGRTPELLATLLRERGWRITLPSEAQWEKAARGGKQLSDGTANRNAGRIYPWGDEFDLNKANTDETNIGTTSAVGCFPEGHSPYDILDMSGNIWEWTRSLWGKDFQKPEFVYPYDPEDHRCEALNAPDEIRRVLRGGSFIGYRRFARCANRLGNNPFSWNWGVGFRVVASPF